MGQRFSVFTVLAPHQHKVKVYTNTYSPYAATEAVVTTPSIYTTQTHAYATAACLAPSGAVPAKSYVTLVSTRGGCSVESQYKNRQ